MDEKIVEKGWAVLPYQAELIDEHYLVSNMLGHWDILERDEFKGLERLCCDSDAGLFERLREKGIIATEENLPKLIQEYRRLNAHLFTDASLHIAVLTTRCNLECRYCQTQTDSALDMSVDVAAQVLKYCFDMRSPHINLEFQGGEPLLNWSVLTFLVEHIRKFNAANKSISISLVTNGTLLDDEKADFLVKNGVSVCISVDGPAKIHDRNRVYSGGGGTYEQAAGAMKRLKEAYQRAEKESRINLLPTLNKESLNFSKEIIDEYISWGVDVIALRPITAIGKAQCQWGHLGYTPEEFNRFWSEAMEYLLELNRQGVPIKERMASVMLKKILRKQDPGYVDQMSPCGAGRSVLTYMPNGDIYPCDEARMTGSDMFRLGNVLVDSYEDVMKSPKMFAMCQSSVMDQWCYHSAFLPWMGTCPVLNYLNQGTIVPKITQTPKYKIERFQLEYLFKKMIDDPQSREIFERWAG